MAKCLGGKMSGGKMYIWQNVRMAKCLGGKKKSQEEKCLGGIINVLVAKCPISKSGKINRCYNGGSGDMLRG